jgi:hypothetical protein
MAGHDKTPHGTIDRVTTGRGAEVGSQAGWPPHLLVCGCVAAGTRLSRNSEEGELDAEEFFGVLAEFGDE